MSVSVLISGLGLMGGSLAACLSRAGWKVWLHHHRDGVAQRAQQLGLGRAVAVPGEAADAELAVVCTPVSTIPATVRAIAASTRAVITDVGSVKAPLVRELADLPQRFLGSHPMAGSHRQGLDHADPDLYRERLSIITPTPATPPAALALVERLWAAAGCRTVRMDAVAHDRAVAEASHLPHVLACCAATGLSAQAAPVASSGFRDTTRVAAASPQLWADILLYNRQAVEEQVLAAEERLKGLRHALADGNRAAVETWLAAGNHGRELYERAQALARA
jgi:prephenate dehydrogenase